MGESTMAEEVYATLLEQTIAESEKGRIYHLLAMTKDDQGDYKEAIQFYEKALEIPQQSLPSNHPDLAMSYGHIGYVYSCMNNHSEAFPFCRIAVDIGQRTLPSSHSHLLWYRTNLERVKKKL
jgi:tetratricopeptide (TPR) repeat protein